MVTNQYPSRDTFGGNPAVLYQVAGLRRLGVNVEVFHIDRASRGRRAYLKCIPDLRKRWLSRGFDLLHVQFGGVQALLGAVMAGRRCIVTFHGSDLHGGNPQSLTSRLSSSTNVLCSKAAAYLAGGVVVVSPNLVPLLPKNARRRARVVPPGVDYDTFRVIPSTEARSELNLEVDKKYILFCDASSSQLRSVKRPDIATAVEREVRVREPGAQLLFLAGQPYWRVPLYVNAADCLLLTSEKEGSPNIVKEALAVNLPIVSVDVGDVADRCRGVPNCQIVTRDVGALANAVVLAFNIGRIGGGRELKRREIDNDIICRQLIEYYTAVWRKHG